MAKPKPQNQGTPPAGTIPASWTINGTKYTVQSTDTETDNVGFTDEAGRMFYVNFYTLRERLKINKVL